MWLYFRYFAINILLTGISPVLTVTLFSAIGDGAITYAGLYDGAVLKYPLLAVGLFLLCGVYIFDGFLGPPHLSGGPEKVAGYGWRVLLPGTWPKLLTAAAVKFLVVGGMLWVDTFATTPLLLAMLTLPASLCALALLKPARWGGPPLRQQQVATIGVLLSRVGHISHSDTFDKAQTLALGIHGLWVLFVWLLWASDASVGGGANGWNSATWSALEADGVTDARFGANKDRVMLLLWMSPAVATIVLWTFAVLTLFVAEVRRKITDAPRPETGARLEPDCVTAFEDADAPLSEDQVRKIRTLTAMFKLLTCLIVLTCGCLWVAASIAGASLRMGSVVQAFVVGVGCFLAMYIYVSLASVDKNLIRRGLIHSPLMRAGRSIMQSDWSKAVMLIPLGCFFWIYLALSVVNQFARKTCIGGISEDERRYCLTKRVRDQRDQMKLWGWTSVLRKTQFLCIAAVSLQVLGGMGTNIFLAFVNAQLQGTSLSSLVVVYLLVGLGMFMLPIVPGIAVYLFGGLLIPPAYARSRGADLTGPEFWVGFLIAVGLNFFLKMAAIVLQQKGVGEPMSTNPTVLQLCQVNKPQMKAVELILRRPGLPFSKVAILCGGPDWPTSVLTGILRLSVVQMLLGSIPVIFTVVTVTAAGAFRLRETESQTWSALSSIALSIASVWSVILMVVAGYYIQCTWEANIELLSRPRREHCELDWLDHVAEKQQQIRANFAAWERLRLLPRASVVAGTLVMLAASFAMLFFQAVCWDDFQVDSPIDKLGLGFIKPLGWLAIAAFAAASAQYLAFWCWLECATRQERKKQLLDLESAKADFIAQRSLHHIEGGADDLPEGDLCLAVNKLTADVQELRDRVPAFFFNATDKGIVQAMESANKACAERCLGNGKVHPDGPRRLAVAGALLACAAECDLDKLDPRLERDRDRLDKLLEITERPGLRKQLAMLKQIVGLLREPQDLAPAVQEASWAKLNTDDRYCLRLLLAQSHPIHTCNDLVHFALLAMGATRHGSRSPHQGSM